MRPYLRTDLTKNRYSVKTRREVNEDRNYFQVYDSEQQVYVGDTYKGAQGRANACQGFINCFEDSLDLNEQEWKRRADSFDYMRKLDYWSGILRMAVKEGKMHKFTEAMRKLRYFGERQNNLDSGRAVCFDCDEDKDDCSGNCRTT